LSVDGRKDMTRKISKWETELWSYLSSGDGAHCPLYGCCQVRQRGGFCFDDTGETINRLVYTWQCNSGDFNVLMNDADFVDFMQRWNPGRIFRLVERLAQKYLKKGGVSCPPVPTKLILLADEDNPVEVHPLPLKLYHGAIWWLKGKWVIQLKASDTRTMKRYTLFHEAFHILAHCQATPVFHKPGNDEAYFNEVLADYFATCMLMPREWVAEKWREVKDIGRMAEIFDVWKPYMWFRLKHLHLI